MSSKINFNKSTKSIASPHVAKWKCIASSDLALTIKINRCPLLTISNSHVKFNDHLSVASRESTVFFLLMPGMTLLISDPWTWKSISVVLWPLVTHAQSFMNIQRNIWLLEYPKAHTHKNAHTQTVLLLYPLSNKVAHGDNENIIIDFLIISVPDKWLRHCTTFWILLG